MTTFNLTPRQRQVAEFIRAYYADQGVSPTLQEIGDHLQKSKVTAYEFVIALIKKRVLTREPNRTRTYRLTREYLAFIGAEEVDPDELDDAVTRLCHACCIGRDRNKTAIAQINEAIEAIEKNGLGLDGSGGPR